MDVAIEQRARGFRKLADVLAARHASADLLRNAQEALAWGATVKFRRHEPRDLAEACMHAADSTDLSADQRVKASRLARACLTTYFAEPAAKEDLKVATRLNEAARHAP